MSADEKDSKTEEIKESDDAGRLKKADNERGSLDGGSNADGWGEELKKRYASSDSEKPSSNARSEGNESSEQDESKPKREFLSYLLRVRVLMNIYRCKRRHVKGYATCSLVRSLLTIDRRFS